MVDFSVIWWNTSLYSYARAEDRRRLKSKYEAQVSLELMNLCKKADIVFLGEFPNGEELGCVVTSVNECLLESQALPIVRGESLFYKRNNKLEFHNALVYRSDRFDLIDEPNEERSITKYRNIPKGNNYRVSQRVRFKLHDTDVGFEFYIVHWNQRDNVSGDAEKARKRASADEILARIYGSDVEYPFKMVLGDFNNEPYEEAIKSMKGSRSIDYVQRHDALYNPFWELMHGENGTICSPDNESLHCNKPMFDFFLVNDRCCSAGCMVVPEIVELDMPHREREHRPIKLWVKMEI